MRFRPIHHLLALLMAFIMVLAAVDASAKMSDQHAYLSKKSTLEEFIASISATDFFPDATGYGPIQQKPHQVAVMKNDKVIGYVFLNSDYVNAAGYSGKPIKILIAVDPAFTIKAVKLVKHSEPIVLIGIPETKINAFMNQYLGRNYVQHQDIPVPDVISGATVTVMVINETIARGVQAFARALNQQGQQPSSNAPTVHAQPKMLTELNPNATALTSWEDMLKQGDVTHLHLTVGEVNKAFADAGKTDAAKVVESNDPNATFIDLYTALVSVPQIGRPLLGDVLYEQMSKRLKPGEQMILVAGNGLYSFKGSGYVRGGIFDRIKIDQGGAGFHFRDRDHQRIGDILVKGAPSFPEIGLFKVSADHHFSPLKPWTLRLLAHRAVGPTSKEFIGFGLSYQLPKHLLKEIPNPEYVEPAAKPTSVSSVDAGSTLDSQKSMRTALWEKLWLKKKIQLVVLAIALFVLTIVFFFQEWFAQHPTFYKRFRFTYLCFTLFWLGGVMNAQLSVVNVFAFTHSLMDHFDWSYFLMDPMIFMLWVGTAAAGLLWNRGAFCGWLCPFGALQELTNHLARKLGIPQIKLPFRVHERMTAIKYLIFLLLFGFSLYDLGLAEKLAEIEPFKTSIILKFARAWPYVAFAMTLLIIGLFIERFYCRYLCPLGAALAIPAKLRLFNWLKRYPECGNPCQKCAQECPVEAIFPEGNINENECIQCLNCQVLYHDKKRCMHLLQEIAKQQRYAARAKRDSEQGHDLVPTHEI